MDDLRKALAPLTDWMPPEVRDRLEVEVWWLILLALALLALLIVGRLVRRVGRTLFAARESSPERDRDLPEDLRDCPLPRGTPAGHTLTVYHLPARLRLVIVAPAGKDADVDATHVEALLDLVLPGLGKVAARDRPRIRVWPPQLSHQGFAASFHRRTPRPEPEGEPSRWVLAAGRAHAGRQPVLLGLGLWTDEPNTLGRLTLEPHQWLDVLRLRSPER
jgi:hypothetical protein